MKLLLHLALLCLGVVIARTADVPKELRVSSGAAGSLRFEPAGDGGYRFDTGQLRGRLRAGGRALGLTEVEHVATGRRLDRSNGLLSHYRVFSRGVRYGVGAWDWPSTARVLDSGAVAVDWSEAPDRPFGFHAIYRLTKPNVVEVETLVSARGDLKGFESFLACYFDPAFSNATVHVVSEHQVVDLAATRDLGDWQMYARNSRVRSIIEDGRWQLEPNPVAWSFPAYLAPGQVELTRRAPAAGLSATVSGGAEECFAAALPHQAEGHYSAYVSLFGRDLRKGESGRAVVTLTLHSDP